MVEFPDDPREQTTCPICDWPRSDEAVDVDTAPAWRIRGHMAQESWEDDRHARVHFRLPASGMEKFDRQFTAGSN